MRGQLITIPACFRIYKAPGTAKHIPEHVARQPARLRILLAGVIGRNEGDSTGEGPFASVAELETGAIRQCPAVLAPRLKEAVEGDLPQHQDDTLARVQGQLEGGERDGNCRVLPGEACCPAGAQRAAAVTRQSRSMSPSSRRSEAGWLANPDSWSASYSHWPLRSPVNIRPVRLAPWAAGAKPMTTSAAEGSPKAGTGRPQYSSDRYLRTFSIATCSRQATSRGQRRQRVMALCSWSKFMVSPISPLRAILPGIEGRHRVFWRRPIFFCPVQFCLPAPIVHENPSGVRRQRFSAFHKNVIV